MLHRPWPLLALAAWAALALGARAQPLPCPKPRSGQCAGDYYQSGGFCAPKAATTKPSIAKRLGERGGELYEDVSR